jgi:hypothetical protein
MCIRPNRDPSSATHLPPQTLRHRARYAKHKVKSTFCCVPRVPNNASQVSTTSKESITDRLFNRRSTTITNNSPVPAHIAITARPIQNLSSLSIYKVASFSLDAKGEYKAQEIKIGPGRAKHVQVDSHRFYLTVFLFIDDEWHLLWNCRQVSASYRIFLNEYHTREARFSNPDPSHIRRASEFSIRPLSVPNESRPKPKPKRRSVLRRNMRTRWRTDHNNTDPSDSESEESLPPTPTTPNTPPPQPSRRTPRAPRTLPAHSPPPYRSPSFKTTYV